MPPSPEALNIDTLLRVYLVVTAVLAVTSWGGARHLKERGSLRLWAWAFGASALTQAVRQVLLLTDASRAWLTVGHLGGLWSTALLLWGLSLFLGQAAPWRRLLLVGGLASVACPLLAASVGGLWPSLALSTAVAAALSFWAGLKAWGAWRQQGGFPWGLLTFSLMLAAVVYVGRSLDAWPALARGPDPFQHANAIGLLALIALTLLQALSLLLLLQDRAMRRIQQLIEIDVLTGLFNRRGFEDRLRRLLARASAQPPVLAVLDVDHFKRINDSHGHAVGDAVLSGIGARLRATLRPTDVAVRLGGEEFAVIWAQVDPPDPGGDARLGERLREAVAAEPFMTEAGPLHVTVSVGVARAGGTAASPETPAQLFSRADQALYAAKAAGRDRVLTAA
ncbi:GGDEF domain-containing protein [Roseateles sp. BYS87W]|uniref:diguanylate cyclase n=1 Tax=Pelomonas baiyunensis TaxID=3299026 RepID=A0ABW7H0H6_9BURK